MTTSSLSVVALDVVAADVPGTVATARRWLRSEIDWAPSELSELAELVLSELVTNAVLHTPGPMRVSASRREDCVAIEVVDADVDHLPVKRSYSSEAATGRGLQIVDRLSTSWGVRALAAGKGVWAVLAEPGRPEQDRCAEGFSPGTWLLDDPTRAVAEGRAGRAGDGAPGGAPPAELVRVEIVDLPLWLYDAAQEHNDALMREFQLLARTDPSAHVPQRLVALAGEARRRFAREGTTVRGQVAAAAAAGARRVDLQVMLPGTSWELLGRLAAQLDEADEFCRHGDLLTLAAPPGVRRFREWYLGEIRSQLLGHPATPWPGPFQPPAAPTPPAGEASPSDDDEEEQG